MLCGECQKLENIHIKNLTNTRIGTHHTHSSVIFEEFPCPSLKNLTVPKLENIAAFSYDSKQLTTLKVEDVSISEFNSFDFSRISVKLKQLETCEIYISSPDYQVWQYGLWCFKSIDTKL